MAPGATVTVAGETLTERTLEVTTTAAEAVEVGDAALVATTW